MSEAYIRENTDGTTSPVVQFASKNGDVELVVKTNTTDTVDWGEITGTINNQTDLKTKFDNITNGITPFVKQKFDLTGTTVAEGEMAWDADNGTVKVGMPGGNVTLQLGQEIHVRAKNVQGSQINDGSLVFIFGASGSKPEIKLAQANASATSDTLIGMATQNIAINQQGFVTVFGFVNDINTNGFAAGTVVYLSATNAGQFTATKPTPPNYAYKVGIVLFENETNGKILINPDRCWERFGGDANYSFFDVVTGFLEFVGSAKYWVDIDFPIIVRTTGAGIPTLTTINGNLQLPQWQVNDTNMSESQEFIHAWEEGSRCYWHLHLTTNGLDATDRYVRFTLEYGYTDSNFKWVFPAVVTTDDLLIPANTPTQTQIIMSLANFLPTGTKIGGHAIARLTRIASVGTAPTNDPFIAMLQLHVLCNTPGSRQIGTK